jgi:glucose-6-phosphate dehydrogenase assembly protein OpcA
VSDDRLASFERGDAIEVPLGKIEQELAALWRRAAEPKPGEKPRPITRACLWNLIVRATGENFRAAKRLIDDISKYIPARVIVLHSEPGPQDVDKPIRAWVEANWRKDGHVTSGSDEVTLFASGAAIDRLPSAVRALLVTDAPTSMRWWGPPPAATAPSRELLREVDRLIVDTRKVAEESQLADYHRLGEENPELEVVDCAWLGVRPLRGLCAGMFDADPSVLERIERVRVISGVTGSQSRALLTLGWLASRLGWSGVRALEAEGKTRRWKIGEVNCEIETRTDGPNHGVAGLELESRGEKWIISRANQCIEVHAANAPLRMQPARQHSDADLVVTSLGARGRDPIFRDALAIAAQLVAP